MLSENNQWHLIGITSYGTGCGLPGFAGVYTRISAYENVIDYLLEDDRDNIDKVFVTINCASSISTCFFWISLLIYLLE